MKMQKQKKNRPEKRGAGKLFPARALLLIVCLLAGLCMAVTVFAEETTGTDDNTILPVPENEKDGLSAALTLEPESDGAFLATVTVKNEDCAYAQGIAVNLKFPDGMVLLSEKPDFAGTVGIGESKALTFRFGDASLTLPESETGEASDSDETTPEKGCSSALTGREAGILLAVFLAGGLFFLCAGGTKKQKGGKTAGFLLVLFAFSAFLPMLLPVGVSAAERERSFSVSALCGETVYVEAEISYQYCFTESEVSERTGMDQFEITYYWGPHYDLAYNEEIVKDIADCGFTSIPLELNSVENNKKALTVMKKYGLTCSALWDSRIDALVNTTGNPTQEEVDAVVQAVVDDYREFDNLLGYYIKDEPSAALFPLLGKIVSAFRRLDPGRSTMINLFPTYAKEKQLGTSTYALYLKKFAEEVDPDYLSYDHYHFKTDGPRAGFFRNLELVRKQGIASGKDQMQIILLTKHMTYADISASQIAWEVNMSLVYGMKRISYFTYYLDQSLMNDNWSNSCVDASGAKQPHYYDVQAINRWLLPLGRELATKDSTAVYHIIGPKDFLTEEGCRIYRSYGDLGEVEGRQFVVGFFSDGSFMFANKKYVEGDQSRNSLTLLDLKDGLEYFDPESASWKSADEMEFVTRNENGNYVLTFEAGMGGLFRVK